jgi:hypothetical protein
MASVADEVWFARLGEDAKRDASLLPVKLMPMGRSPGLRPLQFGHFGEVTSREDFKFSRWGIFFAGLENPLRVMSPENGAIRG